MPLTQLPYDPQHNFPPCPTRTLSEDAVVCRLFSDAVTLEVCMLRKRELDGRGGFSCTGCAIHKT